MPFSSVLSTSFATLSWLVLKVHKNSLMKDWNFVLKTTSSSGNGKYFILSYIQSSSLGLLDAIFYAKMTNFKNFSWLEASFKVAAKATGYIWRSKEPN